MSSHLHLLKEWKKVSITPSWLSLIVSEKTLVWQTWCKSSGHGWLCVYCSVELWEPCWSVHIHDRKIANVFFEANCHNHACVYYMYIVYVGPVEGYHSSWNNTWVVCMCSRRIIIASFHQNQGVTRNTIIQSALFGMVLIRAMNLVGPRTRSSMETWTSARYWHQSCSLEESLTNNTELCFLAER